MTLVVRAIIALGVCWFLCACSDVERDRGSAATPFFDLAGLIDSLDDGQPIAVRKTVQVNGQSETKALEDYDLWTDIQSFKDYDINRPTLFDKYRSDTTREHGMQQLSYQATEEELTVQKLQITLDQGVVTLVDIAVRSNTFIEDMEMEVRWEPAVGYSLDRRSRRRFQEEVRQQVSVTIQ